MPTAFVKYRSGGGYQKVNEYDYVFDARKLWESGYYRDSGYQPVIARADGETLTSAQVTQASYGTGGVAGSGGSYGTFVELDTAFVTPYDLISYLPDEVSHESLRQSSWYETSLTFCNTSSASVTFTADNTTGTLTSTAHGLAGKKVVVAATTTLPAGLMANQIYWVINPTADTFQLSLAQNGSVVAFTSNGTGTLTATVVDTVAEFPWANILGWSDTAPTR
jgi:hypothetical protein